MAGKATRIKGITVYLIDKSQTGEDPFGAPIYSEVAIPVENVIVSPNNSEDMTAMLDLTGKRAEYTLGIPKGDIHEWQDRSVEFFGKRWRVINIPIEGIEDNIPLEWHKKVLVERYE